jgi:hypothetical protein
MPDSSSTIRYFKGSWLACNLSKDVLSRTWGDFEYFIELLGQHVNRQVNVFADGGMLRYNRDHWCDAYGSMLTGTFSFKKKAGRYCAIISQKDFERVWLRARESPNWAQQLATAKVKGWGSWSQSVHS